MNANELADKLSSLILTFEDRGEMQFLKMVKDCQFMLRKLEAENQSQWNRIKVFEMKIREGGGGKYSDIVSDGGLDPRSKYEAILRKAQEK